jgi:hypothetical protein
MGNGKESDTVEIQPFDANDIAMSDHDKFQMWEYTVRVATAQKFSKDLISVLCSSSCRTRFQRSGMGFSENARTRNLVCKPHRYVQVT